MNRKMKDSGVEWIGEIPEDWGITRLKYICAINTGNKNTENSTISGIYPFFVRSPRIENINSYSFDGEAILTAGDGVGAGKVFHYYNGKFDYHQRVYNLHNFKKVVVKYLFQYLKENFYKEIEKGTAKSTVDSIRLPMLLNFPILLPLDIEQQQIASFLDSKCALIDRTIMQQKQVIENLKEYKQSVITEAVTKGLDPNVPMKDSGVEWIGEIPNNWNILPLKYLLLYPLQYGASEAGIDFSKSLPRYIRITDITMGNNLKTEGALSLAEDIAGPYILNDMDILFARSGASVGKTFLYLEQMGRAAFAGYLIRGTINNKNSSKFVYYNTLSNCFIEWKNASSVQATIQNIGAERYANYKLTIPPITEQRQIASFLDSKCSSIDKAISAKEHVITKLEEYKKSLIYEYVTGKKEVPNQEEANG